MTDTTTTPSESVRDNYSEEEWKTLATTPMLVVAGMSFADKTGPRAMMSEFSAGANSYMAGSKHFTDSPLLGALSSSVNQGMFEDLHPQKGVSMEDAAKDFQARSLANLTTALQLIEEKATAADLSAYKQWVLAIATHVMSETKSNTKLGLGGERISAGEAAFFEELKTTLGFTDDDVAAATATK